MSRYYTRPQPPSKPARHTIRPDAPFGAGILASHPFAGRTPFTAADLDWLNEMDMSDDFPDNLEELAAEAAWYAQCEMSTRQSVPEFGRCLVCGRTCDDLTCYGVCDACDVALSEESTNNRAN